MNGQFVAAGLVSTEFPQGLSGDFLGLVAQIGKPNRRDEAGREDLMTRPPRSLRPRPVVRPMLASTCAERKVKSLQIWLS